MRCTRLHYTTPFQVFFGPPSPEIEEQFLSQVSYQHVPTFDIVQPEDMYVQGSLVYLQEMVDLACSDISTNQTPTSPHYQVRGRRYVCIYALVLMGCNRLDRLLLSCQDVTVLTTLTIFAMCGFFGSLLIHGPIFSFAPGPYLCGNLWRHNS